MFSNSPNRASLGTQMLRMTAALALVTSVAGCGKKAPEGQTVATVNGEDITQSELNLELSSAGATPQNKDQVQSQVLQSMIDRKLLVQQAKKDGVDKSPEFVLTERRAREILLAQRAVQSAAQASRQQPTESDVNSYLDKHPAIGEGRRILVLDQVKFAAPRNAAEADAFKPVKTMEGLVALLQSKNQPFERAQAPIDTATVPDDALAKIRQTSATGEPLVIIRGPVAVANVIVGERPAPGNAMDGVKLAKQRLTNERLEASLRQRQDALRKSADIQYADGYKPKTQPGAPGSAPAR